MDERVAKTFSCKLICLKNIFHKDKTRKDGMQRQCVICTKHKQHDNSRKELRNFH